MVWRVAGMFSFDDWEKKDLKRWCREQGGVKIAEVKVLVI